MRKRKADLSVVSKWPHLSIDSIFGVILVGFLVQRSYEIIVENSILKENSNIFQVF